MEYVLKILQDNLNSELRALATANEVINGNGFRLSDATMLAFLESKKLANERIPQLTEAIEKLKQK